MSGSSKSFNNVNLAGCRVAGQPTYTPAHIPANGQKPIRQRATFSVYQNLNGKSSRFRVTAWGKMADIVARSCAPGKELMLECEMHSYQGRIVLPTGPGTPMQFVVGQDGQPITNEKIGLVIRNILFGADSDKLITQEIQSNMRPAFWNVIGHQDNIQWKQICMERNSTQFQPGNTGFGYAVVQLPNGQLVDPNTLYGNNNDTGQGAQGAQGFQGTAQFAGGQGQRQTGGYQNGQQNGGFQTGGQGQTGGFQAAGGFQGGGQGQTGYGQPAAQQNTGGQQIMMHGQNMGYAMPNQQTSGQGQMPPASGGFNM